MKTKLLMLLLFIAGLSFGQKINMSYDGAGNQINRFVAMARIPGIDYKTPETLKESDFIVDDKIAYYPNPVLQQLYVNWKNEPEKTVDNIEIFNMNGQLMVNYKHLNNSESVVIDFQILTDGIYNLIMNYENGTKKSLKIVKK